MDETQRAKRQTLILYTIKYTNWHYFNTFVNKCKLKITLPVLKSKLKVRAAIGLVRMYTVTV